ncbi:oligosaccharide flippase family protein [Sphaerospermopsis aphanizomenoides BCCUSP55]|uniref:lipopolysaccharide biosynthesis protein n=1 Tax=Sphaerospermopsis aphanizomenoides TaxID=459663 RepID=UPI001902C81C|nr:oligosaccharide flippase family protein [Sphaerospermopsis aphanizomenoides]MBK1988485.1 oligosaccharide flippase family protein [Sphaerospermopsis aphanizomenoides BCCUSP55]
MNNTNQSSRSAKKTSFAGDVLKLVSGTAFAQVLTILASPFLTRLYGPEAFGKLAIFLSVTSIIGVIICFRYELAIMLPETDEEAANLLGLSLVFVVLISVLTIPIVWLGQSVLLELLKDPTLSRFLCLVPPMVFFSGMAQALNYWNSRTKYFGRLSMARVCQSVTTTGIQLGSGYTGYATGGTLIVASVVGLAMSTLILGGQIWHDDGKFLRTSINWNRMLAGLRRYSKFPIYGIWSALFNTISFQLPVLMLSNFFPSTVVGYYALSNRLLSLPMSIIGATFSQVFFQRATKAKSEGHIVEVFEVSLKYLLILGIFPFLALTLVGDDIFTVFLGKNWTEAGVYSQILALWIFLVFVGSPVQTLIEVLERQEIELFFNIFLLISRWLSLFIGGLFGNARFTLILFSMTGVIAWLWIIIWLISNAGLSRKRITIFLIKKLVFCLPFLIIISLAKWVFELSPFVIVALYIGSIIIYYLFCVGRDIKSKLKFI